MQILDAFHHDGRGLIVTIDMTEKLPVAKRLLARVIRLDGTSIYAYAINTEESLGSGISDEKQQCVLLNVNIDDVPIGSDITLEIAVA